MIMPGNHILIVISATTCSQLDLKNSDMFTRHAQAATQAAPNHTMPEIKSVAMKQIFLEFYRRVIELPA